MGYALITLNVIFSIFPAGGSFIYYRLKSETMKKVTQWLWMFFGGLCFLPWLYFTANGLF
jgi:hypothetical protein